MEAFSRGLSCVFHQHSLRLPASLRLTLFASRPSLRQQHAFVRAFHLSRSRRLPAPARYPGSSSTGSYMSGDPVIRSVIQTREPILLYQEPPQRKYLFRVYGFATLTMGVGLFNFWWAKELPEEQPWFVKPTYIIIGMAFTAIGVHLFQRPVRRISLLEVIPGAMGGRLQLRVRARKTPWAKESVFTTDIWDATISEKTNPMVAEIHEANRARYQSISQGLEDMFVMTRVWELAARWIDQKWTSFFNNFKFAVLQFGIAEVEVDGVKWKIDCEGYLREEGKAIDRIIAEE